MLHHYPTLPDTSRHFAHLGPSLTLKLQATTALLHFVTSLVTNWGARCHQMAPIVTNSTSHQQLVTRLVTNKCPLTRKIRFVTAFHIILTALSPILQPVTKKRIDDKYGPGRHYSSPRFLVEP